MLVDGHAAKVVIDVFHESGENDRGGQRLADIDYTFWTRAKPKNVGTRDDDGEDLEEDLDEVEYPEIPVHPYLAVFCLARHRRYKIHAAYLDDYVWNENAAANLVLPDISKDLVDTLIGESRTAFRDVVEGKTGGACVMLAGAPGTGKTLTAEVFAEAAKRPLYSVQAAQLGIKATDVETNLVAVLDRGSRWNAVVLIDEADVYVVERGRDMEHNAIVAAWLRVLEYQTSILFLTTNRAETVDDAILSRCIARIDYSIPDPDQQCQIWRILSDQNELGFTDDQIAKIQESHSDFVGRDIKGMLNLAMMVSANYNEKIDPMTIDFVSQFRATKPAPVNIPNPPEIPAGKEE